MATHQRNVSHYGESHHHNVTQRVSYLSYYKNNTKHVQVDEVYASQMILESFDNLRYKACSKTIYIHLLGYGRSKYPFGHPFGRRSEDLTSANPTLPCPGYVVSSQVAPRPLRALLSSASADDSGRTGAIHPEMRGAQKGKRAPGCAYAWGRGRRRWQRRSERVCARGHLREVAEVLLLQVELCVHLCVCVCMCV